MPSYAGQVSHLPGDSIPGVVMDNGKRRAATWDQRWDDPSLQERARKGTLPSDVSRWGGYEAPANAPDGQQWTIVGTDLRPGVAYSGAGDGSSEEYISERIPVWGLTQKASSPKPADVKKDAVSANQSQAVDAAPTARRDAYERAQQYQEQSAAIPKAPPPSNPQSPTFYKDFQAHGRAYIDDYLKAQNTEQKRVELGVAENAYYGNQALRNIDPRSMNISKVDTQQNTLDFLKKLKGLIA